MALGSNLFQNQTHFILCSLKNSLVIQNIGKCRDRPYSGSFWPKNGRILKKTTEFEAVGNGSNAYVRLISCWRTTLASN